MLCYVDKKPASAGFLLVRPAQERSWRNKFSRKLITAKEVKRNWVAEVDTKIESSEGVNVIRMPEHCGLLSPIMHVVPLQLLFKHTACALGTDMDKPHNLAKSVTVE